MDTKEKTHEGFKYFINPNNTITITSGPTVEPLIIPYIIDNRPVTHIDNFAFEQRNRRSVKNIKKLTLPHTITHIGAFAFANNIIKELTLNNILEIGKFAFANNIIEKINLPKTLTQIERGVFQGNKIQTIHIPNNIHTIKKEAFKDNKITKITLSEGITKIEEQAFFNNHFKIVIIPYSVKEIGNQAFSNTSKTKNVIRLHASHNQINNINEKTTTERIKLLNKKKHTNREHIGKKRTLN